MKNHKCSATAGNKKENTSTTHSSLTPIQDDCGPSTSQSPTNVSVEPSSYQVPSTEANQISTVFTTEVLPCIF